MRALILGGMENLALAAARALGERGWEVHVAGPAAGRLLSFSRHCRGRLKAPFDERTLAAYARDCRADMIVPVDVDAAALAPALRRLLPGASFFPTPGPECLALNDKWRFHAFAAGLNLPQPKTWLVENAEQARGLPFPIVLKPLAEAGGRGIRTVSDAAALGEPAYPFLAQEFIPGSEVSLSFLADEGRLLAWTVHERRAGGVVSYIDEPRAVAMGRTLIAAMRYRGLGNIDLRYDSRDPSRVLVIECNPRFWGTFSYARALGVDFLGLGLELAAGRVPAAAASAPTGECPGLLALARGFLRGRYSVPLASRAFLRQKFLDPGPELVKAARSLLGEP